MVTLLNSPRLTTFGSYEYRLISVEEARVLVREGFSSAIGHPGTAGALSKLLGVVVPEQRISYRQMPGEQAIVFELIGRLPEGMVLGQDEITRIDYRLGLLTRTL